MNGGRNRGENSGKRGEGKFRDVEMCVLARNYLCVFVQGHVPVPAIRVLRGRGGNYGGVRIGDSYSVWFKYWYLGSIIWAVVHIAYNRRVDIIGGCSRIVIVFQNLPCDRLHSSSHNPVIMDSPDNAELPMNVLWSV